MNWFSCAIFSFVSFCGHSFIFPGKAFSLLYLHSAVFSSKDTILEWVIVVFSESSKKVKTSSAHIECQIEVFKILFLCLHNCLSLFIFIYFLNTRIYSTTGLGWRVELCPKWATKIYSELLPTDSQNKCVCLSLHVVRANYITRSFLN